ncbi:hypothetical protein DFQ30_007361 [Apophysomyces sp. BC1015]|nr:hypothetical protein DFQ30_007361 [Apophysomyces sp. BC1015]
MSLDSSWHELNSGSPSSNDNPIGSSTEIIYHSKVPQQDEAESTRRTSLNFDRFATLPQDYDSDEDRSEKSPVTLVQENSTVEDLLVSQPKNGSSDGNTGAVHVGADRENDNNDIYANDHSNHNEPNNDDNDKTIHKKNRLSGPQSSYSLTTVTANNMEHRLFSRSESTIKFPSGLDSFSCRSHKRARIPTPSTSTHTYTRPLNNTDLFNESYQFSESLYPSDADTRPLWTASLGPSIPMFAENIPYDPPSATADTNLTKNFEESEENNNKLPHYINNHYMKPERHVIKNMIPSDSQEEEEEERELLRRRKGKQRATDANINDPFPPPDNIFNFKPNIDSEHAMLGIQEHLSSIKPMKQWSTIRILDLRNQNLVSIHQLDQALPCLENLDVSDNAISFISGLPQSLRILNAKTNKLTDIEAFKDLHNLQHLDVCNNAISTFEDIGALCHLRTLHAENNKITSCSPFQRMHGLIKLNLRDNMIRRLRFDNDAILNQLESLDVSYNRIQHVDSIKMLTGLKTLNLDHNELRWFQLEDAAEKLKVLRLCYNRLRAFDATLFPDLRILYLDDNQIMRVIGLSCLARLDSFSLRDQGGQKVEINMTYLRASRKLYLSGNPLKHLNGMLDYFTLEYLELCSIQLEELPQGFARQVPNLGVLYLSHNYLKSIRPIRKLRQLQKLVLIDNRIGSLSHTLETVRSMTRLRYLDLRQNPICMKMYPQISISTPKPPEKISHYLAHEYDHRWAAQDAEFCQKNLPPHWAERRLMYRALFLKHSSQLTMLDNVPVSEQERANFEDVTAKFCRHQDSNSSP